MEAGITAFVHRDLAAVAGIEVILTSFALHQFLRAGDAEALGRGLVSLHFRHTPLETSYSGFVK